MVTPSLPDLTGLLLTPLERQALSAARDVPELSELSRQVLGRDVVVSSDLRAAAAGEPLSRAAAARALDWVEVLHSGVQPSLARPARVNHPAAAGAAVLTDGSRLWWLLDGTVVPAVPTAVRLDFGHALDRGHIDALDGLVRYAMRQCGRGKTYGPDEEAGTHALVWHANTAVGNRHRHFSDRFLTNLHAYLAEGGTPVRKSDGARLISWDGPSSLLVYVDDIEQDLEP